LSLEVKGPKIRIIVAHNRAPFWRLFSCTLLKSSIMGLGAVALGDIIVDTDSCG